MATASDSKFAIHEACREGKTPVVESLLNANPSLASLRDADDRLPLHWACTANSLPIVTLLSSLPRFDPDAADGLGWTPLMIASSLRPSADTDPVPLVHFLLSRGADPNAASSAGQTALHFAASKNSVDVGRALVREGGGVRRRDRRGQLPLHRAAAIGSVPMMRLMLENKSPVNAADEDGMTPLHHAVGEGHGDAAVFLLKSGAQWGKKDREGRLAVEVAPDSKVRNYVLQMAEREGVDMESSGGG